jgi:proliferating cell nuclear antigen PCNA
MEIQISDASLFRRSIDSLREFLPQAQFRISEEGLRISGMDVSHVGFVDYFLSAKDCESVRAPRDTVIGISTTILSKVLSTAGNADHLTLSENGDVLKLSFKTDGRSANFELSTLDIDEDRVDLPEMSYGAIIKARTADIASMVKDLSLFGDEVTLCLDEEGFHMKAAGESGKGELVLEPTDDRDMTMEGDNVEIRFGMKYLQQILKSCTSLTNYMELSFDPSHPLRVKCMFGKESHFIAYLAPKVSDD